MKFSEDVWRRVQEELDRFREETGFAASLRLTHEPAGEVLRDEYGNVTVCPPPAGAVAVPLLPFGE